MIPWIQVFSNLPQHPKTTRLADELGLSSAALNPNVLAVGLLVSLWTWAVQNAYTGDLSGCSARAIAEACRWKKRPETLVKALISSGFLDADLKLHDWEEYASLLVDQEENRRAKTRERVQKYRDRKKAVTDGECNAAAGENVTHCNALCNVTETHCNAPTIPNHTIPDHIYSGGGGESRARAREEVEQFCRGRDLEPDAYFGMTPEIRDAVSAFAHAAFAKFCGRAPTVTDEAMVFQAIYTSSQDETGAWRMQLDDEAKELLLYAFEAAAKTGKAGDWKYIGGVRAQLHRRGIHTLAQAEDYDLARIGAF